VGRGHIARCDPNEHFAEISKMVPLGSGAEREVGGYMLTRYACYLVAPNGDPSTPSTSHSRVVLI
jgi:DNA-damage-inducible protein D